MLQLLEPFLTAPSAAAGALGTELLAQASRRRKLIQQTGMHSFVWF